MRLNSVLKALSLLLESEEGQETRFRELLPTHDGPWESAAGRSSGVTATGLSRLDGRDSSRNGALEASKSG